MVMDDLRFPGVYSSVLASDFAKPVLVQFQDTKKKLKKNTLRQRIIAETLT